MSDPIRGGAVKDIVAAIDAGRRLTPADVVSPEGAAGAIATDFASIRSRLSEIDELLKRVEGRA